jgi:hypothetical protein
MAMLLLRITHSKRTLFAQTTGPIKPDRSPFFTQAIWRNSKIQFGIVVLTVDDNGIPRFQLLQRFQKQPTAPTLYYVFDVL